MSTTIHVTWEGAPEALETIVADLVSMIGHEVQSRGIRVANELRNSSNYVLSGQRHGRRYKVPGTYRLQKDKVTGKKRRGRYYTASAPGEPPAVRTGMFRMSWKQRSYAEPLGNGECNVHGVIESDLRTGNTMKGNGVVASSGKYLLGDVLEKGTKRMSPRPYQKRVVDRAMPRVIKIYKEPYIKE